jgi:hypothetical protein
MELINPAHTGTSADSSEYREEFSGAVKDNEFLDQLGDYQLLTNDSNLRHFSRFQSSLRNKPSAWSTIFRNSVPRQTLILNAPAAPCTYNPKSAFSYQGSY